MSYMLDVYSMPVEEYNKLTRLQDLALFYREPSGIGSQGGYDNLFGVPYDRIPTYLKTEEEGKIWQSHWKYVDGLPDVIKYYIVARVSIGDLGKVQDIPGLYKMTIGEYDKNYTGHQPS